jgi:mRNA-degrading endonuclease RelE of RelBE toxin-antitoxin system
MIIVETKIFTKQILVLLDSEEYRDFQNFLANDPAFGKVIKGSSGLRKIRWKTKSKGKSGGIRIIYFWVDMKDTILLLYAYSKSERDDLSPNQIKILSKIIEEEFS